MRLTFFLGVVALGLSPLLAGATDAGLKAPVAASPGEADRVVAVESRCPAFSWGRVEGAAEYELVVYRLSEEGEAAELALRQSFAGSLEGWTPSLDRCLERGERYGWSVRAVGAQAASGWSQPRVFRVDAGPSVGELQEALRVLRQYLDTRAGRDDTASAANAGLVSDSRPAERPVADLAEAARPRVSPSETEWLDASIPPSSAVGVAALTIEGEVRTVDSSAAPRVWGQGRPGTEIYIRPSGEGGVCSNGGVKFGLSYAIVDWGSAASACPAGTWVCTWNERGTASCDTARPDYNADRITCDGGFRDDDEGHHMGWVADELGLGGAVRGETGTGTSGFFSCDSLAVWCCWE